MKRVAVFCSLLVAFSFGARVVRAEPPVGWDWRDHGGVSSVKYQGNCGSCWAFATVAALESRIMIETGAELDLSEQELLNCTSGGCDGGTIGGALSFLRDEGTVAESVVPYEAAVNPCIDVDGTRYTISGWSPVNGTEHPLKYALVAHGPLVVIARVNAATFQWYSSGVYPATFVDGGPDGTYVTLLLVGYDETDGTWILKNSWGTWWGEDGFVRIEMSRSTSPEQFWAYALLGSVNPGDDCEDADGDGFGSNGDPSCPGGETPDCDDDDPDTYPGAEELCDGIDNDCDGEVPEDEADSDADGSRICDGDCDDDDPDTYPGAEELSDGIDNDCDGEVDEGVDADGDGVVDGEDQCPSSDLAPIVVINGCDSGVANHLLADGCTILDEIAACAAGASNHGRFVSCVSHLTNRLKAGGVISGHDKGAIQSCAARGAG